jgi:glycerol kinase
VEKCIDGAVAAFTEQGHSRSQIKAVGITNQRETTVVWNQVTGEPLYNAIVWTDTRTQALVRKVKERLGADQLLKRAGVPLSTYPSIGKLLWLLENEPTVKDAYEKGILAFGTIDAWLVYRLNGGPKKNIFVSDSSNASRTMLMNIHTLQYDEALIDFFRLDAKRSIYQKSRALLTQTRTAASNLLSYEDSPSLAVSGTNLLLW